MTVHADGRFGVCRDRRSPAAGAAFDGANAAFADHGFCLGQGWANRDAGMRDRLSPRTEQEGTLLPDGLKELRRLDRDILMMTAILWTAHFGILVTRAEVLDISTGVTAASIRFLAALLGALSTLCVYALLRRRPMGSLRRFAVAVALCAPMCMLVGIFTQFAWMLTTMPLGGGKLSLMVVDLFAANDRMLFREMGFTAVFFIWVYVAWCALYAGSVAAAELRDRDSRLAIAEGAAHQAQLMALRFQLNPHFLFNTLNTLSGLIALDRKGQAEKVVLNLSEFLRYSLAGEPEQLVTLAKELEGQRMYLDIERVRFADRLRVRFEIDSECEHALVPAFLLQPLIENAIKHAVAPSEQPVTLIVAAERRDGQLLIRIENSASTDPPAGEVQGFGIGLANVRKRLGALFADGAGLEASRTGAEGWINLVRLPWMEGPADARPDS
jgi:hypothetical protein